MILHPHVDQFYEAIEVLRRIGAIMKVRGLQPSTVRRYIDCAEDDDDLFREFGYLHEIRLEESPLNISWSLFSDSEYGSLCVKVELSFGDSLDYTEISDFCVEYNVVKNEWIVGYNNLLSYEEEMISSRLAQKYIKKYKMSLDTHKVVDTQAAWSVIRDMAEFYFKHVKSR